jgi:hypothetical protein
MERHIEIEHVLRSAHFWGCVQHRVVIPFQLLGVANEPHLEGSKCPRTCLDSRQFAHTDILSVRGTNCYCTYIVIADYQERHSLV